MKDTFLLRMAPGLEKKDEHVLRFNLPKKKGNFRVELAHRNNLNINTDSIYEFQMRVGYAAHDVIFFQVKECGGDMRPVVGDGLLYLFI
ncbi:hypothetical protein UA45_00585 [Morganella morganii]|uniref:Uncharacterized protein n=1 Tax=Morganella morganii TaxID=582 RepID=A0A0D8LBM0_MORMO|nr:hypothetical protein UA45_00585 [Morganella morganii]